jgi:hypothetical protein
VKLRIQKSSFDTTLAGVSKIALVIKDIVDSIHQKVVWNQKEQGSNYQSHINLFGNEQVGREKGECGVHPRNWS